MPDTSNPPVHKNHLYGWEISPCRWSSGGHSLSSQRLVTRPTISNLFLLGNYADYRETLFRFMNNPHLFTQRYRIFYPLLFSVFFSGIIKNAHNHKIAGNKGVTKTNIKYIKKYSKSSENYKKIKK